MDNDKLDMILNRLDHINKLGTELAAWKQELTGRVESNEESVEFAHNEIKDWNPMLTTKLNTRVWKNCVKILKARD